MELEEVLMSEEAFEELIRNIELVEHMTLYGRKAIKQNVEKMQRQITKQEKMIELLIKHICDVIDNDDGACLLPFYNSDENLEEKVKQYFDNKANEEDE